MVLLFLLKITVVCAANNLFNTNIKRVCKKLEQNIFVFLTPIVFSGANVL